MAKQVKTSKVRNGAFWRRVLISSVVAGLMLVIANSAFWVNKYVFDTDNFTSIAVESVTSEPSRQAIAGEVVDTALKDYPVARQVAGSTATRLISSLLATNQFEGILTTAVSRLQVYLTSENRESVVLNLSNIKSSVESLIDLSGRDSQQLQNDISSIPDQIVLIDASNIPSFYKYGLVFLWLGPLAALLALALFAYPYIRNRKQYYVIAAVQGVIVVLMGLLSQLIGPLFRPPLLANVESANARVVVGNLYDAFMATFNSQAQWFIWIGLAVAVVPFTVRYGLRYYKRWSHEQAKKTKVTTKK